MLHKLTISWLNHASYSLLLHSLDHIREEPELEVQAEQAQAKETGPDPDQGKPQCITSQSLIFIWIAIFMLRLIVH
jgi:hypothetical protein